MLATDSTYAPTAVNSPAEPSADALLRAVWISVAVLAVVYVALFASGIRFFVFKTAVLPIVLIYGLLVRQRLAFITDWTPLLGATVLFDAIRGLIYTLIQRGHHTYYLEYVVRLEEAMFGVSSISLPLQTIRTPALDLAAVMIHASHFAFFLLFGLALWHARREQFRYFRRAMVLVMIFGLVGYAVIPTVPPWLAAEPQFHFIPPIAHVIDTVYTHYVPELYGAFSTNPVAAMPSLHAAFPLVCAIVAWRAYGRRAGAAFMFYALAVMFVVMYLGEHYAVDVVAGAIVAVLAAYLAARMTSLNLSTGRTLAVGIGLVAATAAIAIFSPYIPVATF